MAVAAANKLEASPADGSSAVTSSVSLIAGRLYLLVVGHSRSTADPVNTPTVTGASQTWTLVDTHNFSQHSGRRRVSVFRCLPTADASGALTISFGGQAQINILVVLDEFTGSIPAGLNGANAIVQSDSDEATGSVASFTVTLAAFQRTGNATYGVIFVTGTTPSPGTGFVEVGNVGVSTFILHTQFRADADTTTSWSLSPSSNVLGGIAIEIRALQSASFAGALTFAGSLVKKVKQAIAGALTFSGAYSGRNIFVALFSGALTLAGALGPNKLSRTLAGALTSAGALTKKVTPAAFTGALTFSGAVSRVRKVSASFAGALAFAGDLARRLVPTPISVRIGRRLIQMHAFVHSPDANGGPGDLKLDLTPDLLNTFWQRSQNLSGAAAAALPRSNPKLADIEWQRDHLALWRETPGGGAKLVFQGRIADPSIGPGDVVIQAIDYLGYLQRSRTGYRTLYPSKKIGSEIVSPEWLLAKNTADSPLEFVATGTIQNPLALDGVTEMKTNSKFGVVMYDRLFVFFALAEMSMANTDNNVVFEITLDAATPTFNFWRNRSADYSDVVLSYPGNLVAFNYAPGYRDLVNDMGTVIKKASGGQEEYSLDDAASIALYRRLQSTVAIETLLGLDTAATETDQMKAALARLLAEGVRLPKLFVALPRYAEVDPTDFDLGDNMYTFIQKAGTTGGDELAEWLRVISVAAAWRPDAGESVQLFLRGK